MDHALISGYSREVIGFLSRSSRLQEWSMSRDALLARVAKDEPWMYALPVLACLAVGGQETHAIPVAAAWTMMYHAANLIDEVQDSDLEPGSLISQPGVAITISLSWIFTAIQTLIDSGLQETAKNRIVDIFSRAGFDSSMGQYQSTTTRDGRSDSSDPLENYWSSVILKSGSVYRSGVEGGAMAGSGSRAQIEALGDYGIAIGVIRQVIDDCRDMWVDRAGKTKKATLPALLIELVGEQQIELVEVNGKPYDLTANHSPDGASKLLMDAGILEIIADILLEWRRQAEQSLQVLENSPAKINLIDVIEHILNSPSILP